MNKPDLTFWEKRKETDKKKYKNHMDKIPAALGNQPLNTSEWLLYVIQLAKQHVSWLKI